MFKQDTSPENSFSWDDPVIIRQVFFAGSVYFFLTSLYSLLNYEHKFLLDGSSILFYIANLECFSPAEQREIMWLGQLFPVIMTNAGAGLNSVMIGYVLNICLFYYFLFWIIIYVLEDALSAIFLLFLHFKGDPYNYFFMVEELLPGACLIIVLISVIRHFHKIKNPFTGYAAVFILALFIVRSHPLALVCLACTAIILYLSNPGIFVKQRAALIVVTLTTLLFTGIKAITLSNYDLSVINSATDPLQSVIKLLHPSYFNDMMLYIFHLRLFFTLTFAICIIYLLLNKRHFQALLFIGVTLALIVLFNTKVEDGVFNEWNLSHTSYDRWSLPIRFWVFGFLCLVIFNHISNLRTYRILALLAILIFPLSGLMLIEEKRKSDLYMQQANLIIDKCRQAGVKKALINVNQLDNSILLQHNSFIDIMVLSSMEHPDSTIQVIYTTTENRQKYLRLHSNRIVLHEGGMSYPDDLLNRKYFNLKAEPYTYVDLGS